MGDAAKPSTALHNAHYAKFDYFEVGHSFVAATLWTSDDLTRLRAEVQRLMATGLSKNLVVAAGMIAAIDEAIRDFPNVFKEQANV